ncbi:MAG: hypothetical protein GQ547_03435 [Methylophaga sp.]|nr:hypothetical protein [Methylophaga sp.]
MPEKSTNMHAHIATDTIVVVSLSLLTWFFARYFDLSERFYNWSRVWENYQADELFFPLFSLSLGLIWFSYRRYQHVKINDFNTRILLSENRRLVKRLTETQENERLFLAQELHDIFAQHLTALRTNAETIQALVGNEKMAALNAAKMITNNVEKLHHITRSLLKTLRPPPLDFGVVMAIEDLVTEWQHNHSSVHCQLNFHGDQSEPCEKSVLTLYRTIQEGLSNISRHSKAKNVVIDFYFPTSTNEHSSTLKLRMIDNGSGINLERLQEGLGLIGLRERAQSLNGQFRISNNVPSGCILNLILPINEAVQN